MPLYMYEAAYTAESWAAQMKNPQNRVEAVGRASCEAVGGKLIGGWYCFGDYDLVIIADVPSNESMAAIALAIGAGGAINHPEAFREGLDQIRQLHPLSYRITQVGAEGLMAKMPIDRRSDG